MQSVIISVSEVTGRFANESFRQPSVRKRVGSIRKRPIVVSQTSYITLVTGRFANESFRQPSVRKRVGSIRKRPIVVSQTSYITLSAQG